jgi:hypothetical protein
VSSGLTFESVLAEILDARQSQIHTAIPAQIINYDSANQVVDVQPMILEPYHDSSGALRTRSYPVLPSVPVAFPRGGGFFISLPLVAGDTGMLIFSELPIDRWRSSGQESHPLTARRHGAGNAVFYPGIGPRAKALGETGIDANLALGKEGGVQVQLSATVVNLGEKSAVDFVALSTKVATELTRIQTDLTTLKAAIAAMLAPASCFPSGPAIGGLIGATALTAFNGASSAVPSSPSSVAAVKVKAT